MELVDPTERTPSAPSSVADSGVVSDISTPKTLTRVKKLQERLNNRLSRLDDSPTRTRQFVKKLAKAAAEFSQIA